MQLVRLAVLDDQPARRGAALPGGQISRLDRDHGGRRYVLRIPHDQRIIAAQLEREHLVRHVRELTMKRLAGARRAGEQQAVDAGLRRQRLALLRPADQQPHDAFGNPGLVQAFDQERADRGRLFGWLEHHRIAGDQRGHDVPVGQMRREIIRPEHGEHAMGLVADGDAVAERRVEFPLRRPLGISVDRNVDLVDDRADLGLRLP